MRSLLIILAAVALLGGGFFIYYALQTSTPHASADRGPRAAPTTAAVAPPAPEAVEGAGPAGPGNDVWVQSLDDQMRVAFQFRASRYDPTKEGPVNVTNPQAEVFIGRDDARQVVRIEGKTGRVVMPSDVAQRSSIRGNEASAPRRGELKDVTISLFDEADRSRPLLTCRVNNIAFDNDTFRIATEAYTDPAGADVAADQVKVEVRGEDFDFDGRGLTIQWNEADRRLQLLEIAHGERLTIKSPEMLQALDRTAAPRRRARAQREPRRDEDGADVILASARQAPAAKPKTPAASAPLYRATFREQVRITRGGEVLASADQMLVDFLSDREEPVSTPGGARRRASAGPAPKPDRPRDATAAQQPSTAPAQPVDVTWAGRMRVTALSDDAPRPAPGSLNVAMSSEDDTPVALKHQGMDVRCAAFDYRSGDDSLAVMSSGALPTITMTLANGTTVSTPSVVYTGADAKATLRGAGSAEIPLPQEGEQPAQTLTAAWAESCVLTLVPGPGEARELRPDRARFAGDVRVDHPQLSMKSDALELGFDPTSPADEPSPSEVKATGTVLCRLVDAQGSEQRINCDELTVAVAPADADGKVTPKTLVAEGSVVATDEGTELRAGRLTVALAPVAPANAADKQPRDAAGAGVWGGGDFAIESVTAQQDVKLSTPDGRTASAQQAHVVMTPDGTVAELLGQPATLGDGTHTLWGPHIKYEQGPQRAGVQGPGSLAFTVRDAPDQPARRVTAAWEKGLSYDGVANRAELTGGASVTAPAADGATQRASADRIVVTFADAPGPPTTSAARDHAGAGDGGAAPLDGFDLAGNKVLRRITLSGDAQVQSTLEGEGEGQIRRIHLLAAEVDYDVESKRAEVPGAGRMLVQDTLPVREQETGNRMLGSFRGATAFQWAEQLAFDEAAHRITMSGSVLIVHEDPQRPDQPFRMEAAQVRADLLDNDRAARSSEPQQQQQRDTTALFGPSKLHLKGLAASGDVRLSAPQIQIDAQEVAYDAVRELLTARGTDGQPVQMYDRSGSSRGSFEEIVWDARAELIKQMREVRAQVRR